MLNMKRFGSLCYLGPFQPRRSRYEAFGLADVAGILLPGSEALLSRQGLRAPDVDPVLQYDTA